MHIKGERRMKHPEMTWCCRRTFRVVTFMRVKTKLSFIKGCFKNSQRAFSILDRSDEDLKKSETLRHLQSSISEQNALLCWHCNAFVTLRALFIQSITAHRLIAKVAPVHFEPRLSDLFYIFLHFSNDQI